MRRTMSTFASLTLAAVVALATAPAAAHDGHRGFSAPAASVFPAPRDPWRSWGVRSELPRRVGPPRTHVHDPVTAGKPAPGAVWVPGQWVWDGATWLWWPGHWVR